MVIVDDHEICEQFFERRSYDLEECWIAPTFDVVKLDNQDAKSFEILQAEAEQRRIFGALDIHLQQKVAVFFESGRVLDPRIKRHLNLVVRSADELPRERIRIEPGRRPLN